MKQKYMGIKLRKSSPDLIAFLNALILGYQRAVKHRSNDLIERALDHRYGKLPAVEDSTAKATPLHHRK